MAALVPAGNRDSEDPLLIYFYGGTPILINLTMTKATRTGGLVAYVILYILCQPAGVISGIGVENASAPGWLVACGSMVSRK